MDTSSALELSYYFETQIHPTQNKNILENERFRIWFQWYSINIDIV